MATTQPPLGDDRGKQRATDPSPAISLTYHEVADPSFKGGVIQPSTETKQDEPGRLAVSESQERRRVDIIDQGLEHHSMRLGIGVEIEPVQLAHHGQGIGEVVAPQRANLDARRSRDSQAADRAVRIAERHYRPVKSGVRFSRKAAMPSFWSSLANRR